MKNKNIIYSLILVCVTFASMWALPALVRKATYSPDDYPFVYYSSMLKEFGLIDYKNKENPMTDTQGNIYSAQQFDSLMPLLNYRQLMSDGRLPDSLDGYEITPQILRATSITFRYNPKDVSSPDPGLYILFESMPKRVGLEVPPDVFRLHNHIEFIDAATNKTDVEKSERFQAAFEKAGFAFPAQWSIGNPNPRKPYDEGYFSLDAAGNLFHLKMVNGRPYLRDTKIGQTMDIFAFSMYEAPNKRFYGFLFDRQGGVHIVESDEQGGYEAVRLDIDPIDPRNEQVTVMGNLLYWTVTVSGAGGRRYYGLETLSLAQVGRYEIAGTPNNWDKSSKWLFPAYLTFEHGNTNYIMPRLTFTGYYALAANILAAAAVLLLATVSRRKKIGLSVYVLITGLAGLLAVAILPGFRNKQTSNKHPKQ